MLERHALQLPSFIGHMTIESSLWTIFKIIGGSLAVGIDGGLIERDIVSTISLPYLIGLELNGVASLN